MAKFKLQIETGTDNPVLRTKSAKVKDVAAVTPKYEMKLGEFVQEMKKVMDWEKGLGLAAPQVSENLRICLCKLNPGTDKEMLFVMVNPEIVERSDGRGEKDSAIWDLSWGNPKRGAVSPDGLVEIDEEGCLSLPSYYVNVVRARWVTVRFLDGKELLKKGRAFKGSGRDGGLTELTMELNGLNARVVQHEIDHLNSILLTDNAL